MRLSLSQQEDPRIDRAAAEETALAAVSDEVRETELEREGGSVIYEVEVAGEDGKLHEVTVDATYGRALGQELEDDGYEDQGSDDRGFDVAE